MSDKSGIRMDEWLKELSSLGRKSAEGFTTDEAAASARKGLGWTRSHMRRAFVAGLLEMAGSRESVRMDGRPCWVPVYRIVKGVARPKGGKK